jgi:hypothetical protein
MIQRLWTPTGAFITGALLLLPAWIRAQEPADSPLRITSSFGRAIRADEAIELRLNRRLEPASGRLALIIADTDWSALLESTELGVVFRPTILTLPIGEHKLEVFLVSTANEWRSLAQHKIRIIAAAARRTEIDPTFDVTNKGQIAEGHRPSASAPPRATFQDFSVNGSIRTSVARGGWTGRMQMSVLGVSNRGEALRVRERPESAPLVDLADYLVSAGNDWMTLSLGHVSFGTHRQLFNGFSSRGALAAVRLGPRMDVALSALHGSSIVGWNHVLGFERREHRVVGATVGLEMFPRRPGGLRLEGSWMDGDLLPLTGFNEGRVNDAEESRGGGLRVIASDVGGRFRMDGGYARSTFLNPNDALRAQGSTAAPIPEASRNAQYLDVSYAVLREKRIGADTRANVVAAYRTERVDPQYGSVMTDLKTDLSQHAVDLSANVGTAALQAAYTRARDNLDEIPALVKTLTDAILVNAAAPLLSVLRGRPHAVNSSAKGRWWPLLTYSLNRIHQRGRGVQTDTESLTLQLPDQVATDQLLGFDWDMTRWRVGYRVNHTYQDNRQAGEASSDLANLVQNITVDLAAGPQVDLQMAVAFERAENRKLARIDYTRRVGVNGMWRMPSHTVLTGGVSSTALEDDGKTSDAGDVDFNLELSKKVPLFKNKLGPRHAQLFVRYSRQVGHRIDRLFALDDRRQLWTFNTGFNLTLF